MSSIELKSVSTNSFCSRRLVVRSLMRISSSLCAVRSFASVSLSSLTALFNNNVVITITEVNPSTETSPSFNVNSEKVPWPFKVPQTAVTEQNNTAVILSCCSRRTAAQTKTGITQKDHRKTGAAINHSSKTIPLTITTKKKIRADSKRLPCFRPDTNKLFTGFRHEVRIKGAIRRTPKTSPVHQAHTMARQCCCLIIPESKRAVAPMVQLIKHVIPAVYKNQNMEPELRKKSWFFTAGTNFLNM